MPAFRGHAVEHASHRRAHTVHAGAPLPPPPPVALYRLVQPARQYSPFQQRQVLGELPWWKVVRGQDPEPTADEALGDASPEDDALVDSVIAEAFTQSPIVNPFDVSAVVVGAGASPPQDAGSSHYQQPAAEAPRPEADADARRRHAESSKPSSSHSFVPSFPAVTVWYPPVPLHTGGHDDGRHRGAARTR